MSGQNKTLVRRYIEQVWNQGNFAIVDELMARDFVGHQPGAAGTGPEDEKQYFAMLRSAFPDIHFTNSGPDR